MFFDSDSSVCRCFIYSIRVYILYIDSHTCASNTNIYLCFHIVQILFTTLGIVLARERERGRERMRERVNERMKERKREKEKRKERFFCR